MCLFQRLPRMLYHMCQHTTAQAAPEPTTQHTHLVFSNNKPLTQPVGLLYNTPSCVHWRWLQQTDKATGTAPAHTLWHNILCTHRPQTHTPLHYTGQGDRLSDSQESWHTSWYRGGMAAPTSPKTLRKHACRRMTACAPAHARDRHAFALGWRWSRLCTHHPTARMLCLYQQQAFVSALQQGTGPSP